MAAALARRMHSSRSLLRFVLPLLAATPLSLASADAAACGGTFATAPPPGEAPVTVTSERWALAVGPDQTTLWASLHYTGTATDFAWVLPVRGDARLEVASDAWFQALDTFTATHVESPPILCEGEGGGGGCACGGFGSASSGAGTPPPRTGGQSVVSVVETRNVGPYEVVRLRSSTPGALVDWLTSHAYVIADHVRPVIDLYVSEGYDFEAMRLAPGAGVQDMKPVRVVMKGGMYTIPLRMATAGAGDALPITLFVLSESRASAASFTGVTVPTDDLVWDWAAKTSNYASRLNAALTRPNAPAFTTTFAMPGVMTSPLVVDGQPVSFSRDGAVSRDAPGTSFAELYAARTSGCPKLSLDPKSSGAVRRCGTAGVAQDAGDSGAGDTFSSDVPCNPGEIPASDLVCGADSDLAEALIGLRASSTWLTRLEISAPRDGAGQDLVVEPSAGGPVTSWVTASVSANPPCTVVSGRVVAPDGGALSVREVAPSRTRAPWIPPALAVGVAALTLLGRRRRPMR